MKLFVVLILLFSVFSCDTHKEHEGKPVQTVSTDDGYIRVVSSDLSDQSIQLDYKFHEDSEIEFRLTMPLEHTDWIGLGIDDDLTMPDADNKIVFWNDETKTEHTISDRFSSGRSEPIVDTIQNISLSELKEINGLSVWVLRIPISNDENNQDFEIKKGADMSIHVAKGVRVGSRLERHRFRIALSVSLIN